MQMALRKITDCASQSAVMFDAKYQQALMEMQTIIWEKCIHHLHPVSMWNTLTNSLLPLNGDDGEVFVQRAMETSIDYVRVLVFGDSVDAQGVVRVE